MTGKEVRRIRRRLGLSQPAFAVLVGVTANSAARWERGEMGVRESAARLMRLLDRQHASAGKPADVGQRPTAGAKAVLERERTRRRHAVDGGGDQEKSAARGAAARRALLPGAARGTADLQVGGDRRVDRERHGTKRHRSRRR
ncbi:MAG: helix-turn-helix domain-containing protein [Deltaproteobacteria bacterium]|nr:helix-turn-helix domain-containing protein [Deltaproteobacteria bacterium]